MAFYGEEYKDLLKGQRVLAECLLKPELEPRDCAQVTRALVDLVRLKRDIRGQPDPKPIDGTSPKRRRSHGPDSWSDPTTPKQG